MSDRHISSANTSSTERRMSFGQGAACRQGSAEREEARAAEVMITFSIELGKELDRDMADTVHNKERIKGRARYTRAKLHYWRFAF